MTAPAMRSRHFALAAPAVCVVLTLCFGVVTYAIGWWGVPVVALAWGFYSRKHTKPPIAPGLTAAACAVAAWAALLVWTAALGPFLVLIRTLGAVVGVPGPALVAIPLVFVALLAWSATAAVRP